MRSLAIFALLAGCTLVDARAPGVHMQAIIIGQGDVYAGPGKSSAVGAFCAPVHLRAANYTDQVSILSALFSAAAAYVASGAF